MSWDEKEQLESTDEDTGDNQEQEDISDGFHKVDEAEEEIENEFGDTPLELEGE